jgi:hypothetical protein
MTTKPRKRYRVTAEITISVSTVVFATSPKAAIDAASEQPMQSLCHQCASGDDETEWCTSGKLDGEPKNPTAEEEEDG